MLIASCTEAIHSDTSKIGECEFTLISEMNSQLIVHHPYRTLSDLQAEFSLDRDETSTALSIINDHYLTDLPLLHSPHVIAVAAVFLAVVIRPTQSSLHVHSAAGFANALHSLGGTGNMGNMGNVHAAAAAAQGAAAPPSAQAQAKVQKVVAWLSESTVDIEAVVECTQEMISLYEVWEQYNEKAVRDTLVRLVKSRGLDK
jgi:cyclin-C